MYQITCAIRDGLFPAELIERKIGAHSDARLLNLANRLFGILCPENPLEAEFMAKSKIIVQFVVDVYSPMWFAIKVKNS